MIVNYRIWLKDRENSKSRMQFIVTKFFVDDIVEKAHDLLLTESDFDWKCYRVDLVNIVDFTH